ncbi:hypothetical protein [Leptospira paudalimensis]|uniref:Outer membrane lipoprotein carrier protein LolA n=1 Tax=Leptospira paudalimensis TaxID=2950024 RepID=A0ABT3M6I9_9LEPT|nr:hypothetical protein [Leptospira paudalimensis]MCW7503993.1 hypothetical protein [Leptospira paudalimensis]
MTLFFQKKNQSFPKLHSEVIERIKNESLRLNKEQVLFVRLVQNQSGVGEVQVSFADRIPGDTDWIRFANEDSKKRLHHGEFSMENGKIYYHPNVELKWKHTPKERIHRIESNYQFSNGKVYLDQKDYDQLVPILKNCFLSEQVDSLYMDGNICQLEIESLDDSKEERISEVLLIFFSSFYPSPFLAPHRPQ